MVRSGRRARGVIHLQLERRADSKLSLLDLDLVGYEIAELLLDVQDARAHAGTDHHTDIADLSAGLAVERRLIENGDALLALAQRCDLAAAQDERLHYALGDLGLVAQKLRCAEALAQREPDRLGRRLARARPGPARLGALALHRLGEAFGIDAEPSRAQRVLREVERKSVCVVEPEGDFAGELAALGQVAGLVLEDREAARQRRAEARLLELQGFRVRRPGAAQLG